jgi:arylformamidase
LPAAQSCRTLGPLLESIMPIDYEKEYDSRARIPEFPEIFARRDRDAEAYRQARPDAEIGLSYGPTPRQTVDLFPAKDAEAPLALFIHGGWWRSLGPSGFSHMAKGPNAHGVNVGVVGYDLCPNVTVATVIEEMRAACLFLWRRLGKRITAYGSSAGAHLVACLVATDFSTLATDAPADLVPAGYAISGVYDVTPAVQISVNADLRLTAEEARRVSPVHWRVPPGRKLDAVVGALESSEFFRQAREIVEAWGARGAATRYAEIAGTNHFTATDALADPASAMTARVVELARGVAALPL